MYLKSQTVKYAFLIIGIIVVVYSIASIKKNELLSVSQLISWFNPELTIECSNLDGPHQHITQKQCTDFNNAKKSIENSSYLNEVVLNNWETEANLPVIQKNKHYDFVLLGSSHARIFSRYNNHLRVENLLNKKFINLSQGAEKGGVVSQQTYLRYFYQRGNTTKTLIYFVDPFMFYNSQLDDNSSLYKNEPFRLDFYYQLLMNQPKNSNIIEAYAAKRLDDQEATTYPQYLASSMETKTTLPSQSTIDSRVQFLYQDSYDEKKFNETVAVLMETVNIAREKNNRVVLIIPSTLFPKQIYDNYVFDSISKASRNGEFEYYNYSSAINDLDLYHDVDHLNTNGVLTFTKIFLEPILLQ